MTESPTQSEWHALCALAGMAALFRDRRDAGQQLASAMQVYAERSDVVVLGLARGGVPVAFEVARTLHAPLDVLVVRKLGVPGYEELAMGAVAAGGVRLINWDTVRDFAVHTTALESVIQREEQAVIRRELAYRPVKRRLSLKDRATLLIDDGLATGDSMSVAIAVARKHHASRVVVGVPVAAAASCSAMKELADEVVCAVTPEPFHSVGVWYEHFSQTTDNEVRRLLSAASQIDHT